MTGLTPRNLIHHEIIGLKAEIISSSDPTHKGISGQILDETRKMFVLQTASNREVKIPKKNSIFKFKIPNGRTVIVEGGTIIGRPEDRLKMRGKLW